HTSCLSDWSSDVCSSDLFDPTTPKSTRLGSNILAPVQPASMSGTRPSIYTRLVDRVRVVRHSDEHVVSVDQIVSNTATHEAAMRSEERRVGKECRTRRAT